MPSRARHQEGTWYCGRAPNRAGCSSRPRTSAAGFRRARATCFKYLAIAEAAIGPASAWDSRSLGKRYGRTAATSVFATCPATVASSSSMSRSPRQRVPRKRCRNPASDTCRPSGLPVAIIIPAEGVILERLLDTVHSISSEGLSRHAYGQFDAARMRTAWGRRRRRRFALTEDGDVLASAMQYDLAAVLDQQPVRVCGIAQIFPQPAPAAGGPARELVD